MNKMYISNTDARLLGGCGGIAEFFDLTLLHLE